jgi:hypothetical protein
LKRRVGRRYQIGMICIVPLWDQGAKAMSGDHPLPVTRSECLAALGLDSSAQPEQIRRAFRQLVLKLHPDRVSNTARSTPAFVRVVEAYKQLKVLGLEPVVRLPEVVEPAISLERSSRKPRKRRINRDGFFLVTGLVAGVLGGGECYRRLWTPQEGDFRIISNIDPDEFFGVALCMAGGFGLMLGGGIALLAPVIQYLERHKRQRDRVLRARQGDSDDLE